MSAVLTFVGAHWRGLLGVVGGAVIGAYLGRVTAPKPVNLPPPACPACPELQCAVGVDAGVSSQADCKSKVVVRYVTTDAGCPEPIISVDTTGNSSSGATTTTGATADAKPPPPPLVPLAPVQRPPGPTWEVTGGAGVSLDGHLHLPVGVRWYPGGGTLGLGVEGGVRPSDWKQSSVGLSVTGRWGP